MALRLFQREHKTLNIVFTDHAIRCVELKTRTPLVVQQFGERYIDSGLIKDGRIMDKEMLSLILKDIIDEWGLKHKSVRFIVPDSTIAIRKLNIPSDIVDDEVKGYLFLEIGTSIHLPFEEPLFDVYPLTKNGDHKEVLLVATEEKVVESYIDLLEEVGLKPEVADISPLALYRLYHTLDQVKMDDHAMLLHFNRSMLTITIFHQHVPLFMRPISIDENEEESIQLEAATEQGIEGDLMFQLDGIVKDINQIMSFYQFTINKGTQQVNRILLSGDHPKLSMIKEYLSNQLSDNLEKISIENIVSTSGQTVPESLNIALGLALKEVR